MSKFTQEDLDKVLDQLHQGPIGERKEHHWDTVIRQAGVLQPQFFTPQAREKAKDNLAQNTKQWRDSRRRYLTGRPDPVHSEKMSGKGNANYGKGYTYTEVTTGFTGTASEVAERFGISRSNVGQYASTDRPMKSGKCKGLHFKIIGDVKVKTKTPSTFFIEVTTNTKGTARDMLERFGVSQSCLIAYSKRDTPGKRGKHKGLHFKRLS